MRKIILLAILIAILAFFFASAHPDGLEKVAENLGFINLAVERNGFEYGLLPSIAAILGIGFLFWGVARVLKSTV